ncbi:MULTISPECIES: hypothetical protein [Niastella]|uniref:DUF4906 domain-containing protein n=1 Tax=Niastella soli TaxID=2821487 RepID=A0ABS3YLG0_9BACT|nr:hypothetical protein [Niastella soli]MBO9198720.1 hypothetical protein [Niastella soli]
MEKILKLSITLAACVMLIVACHKKDFVQPDGTVDSPDFVYNVALKGFQPQTSVSGSINATINMEVIYYYLQRESKQDTLIQVDFPPSENRRDYQFEVKAASWAGINLAGVKGLKLLCVQDNSASFEKIINITYFDPNAPVLTGLPNTMTPALNGASSISGKASSETGLAMIYYADNRNGNFVNLDSVKGNGSKEITLNYNYTYGDGAGQFRVIAKDIYGLKTEKIIQFVNIPFKPVIAFSATELQTALPDGKPEISGTLKSYSPISTVTIYAVTNGGETVQGTVTPVLTSSASNDYNYSFTYSGFGYATNVTAAKLVAKDAGNSQNSASVPVKILPYYYWKNITMMSQGTATVNSASCFFTGDVANPIKGGCDVVNDASTHAKIDFALFTNSAVSIAFQNPANISASTLLTFKCNGTSWAPATPTSSTLKKTLFRVLGTGSAETNVANRFNSNSITEMSDAFFTGVSAPSASAPNNTQFSTGSVIYAKMTPAGGSGPTKNILIKIIGINPVASPNQGTSTLTFDIMKEQ